MYLPRIMMMLIKINILCQSHPHKIAECFRNLVSILKLGIKHDMKIPDLEKMSYYGGLIHRLS